MDATTRDLIVTLDEQRVSVADIAKRTQLSVGRVYSVLRVERPERKRSPRPRTSDLPAKIKALAAQEIKPARIALLLNVSRAYVYRHIDSR